MIGLVWCVVVDLLRNLWIQIILLRAKVAY